MGNKGFIKVVEAVVASIIVLASLTYFFGYYVRPSEWSNAQIKLQSQDILNTIQSSGHLEAYMKNVDADAYDNLKTVMQNMVSDQVGFAIDIIGAPSPLISIACVECDDIDDGISEESSLRNRISPFDIGNTMRGRNIRLAVTKKTIDEVSNAPRDYDIMFIYGYPNDLTAEEITKIKQYLAKDGNVILFGDNTDNLDGVFDFSSEIDPTKLAYYYSDISGGGSPGGVATSGNEYEEGRAVWIDYYSNPSDNPNELGNNLLQSVIMWTAEDFSIIPEPVFTLTLPKTFFRTFYSVSTVNNAFDMYKVSLTLWYIF